MKRFISILGTLLLITFNYSIAQDFWQPTNGPFGNAQVNDFLYYGDSTIFLATSEGLIKSTDNGNTWERNSEIPDYSRCLSMDSLRDIYLIVDPAISAPYIIKSTDRGTSWSTFNINNIAGDFRTIMIFYKDTIIVGTWDQGLYRTVDGGINWVQINNGLDYLHIYQTVLLSNNVLLVGTSGSGVYRSSDCGDNWTDSNNGIPIGGNGYRYVSSILEIDSGKILCGTQNGIYYSTNYGNNWVYRSIGMGNKSVNDLIIDRNHHVFAGVNLNGVYTSTNEGNSWTYLGLNYSIYTLDWDANLDLCAGGLGSGLNRFTFEDSTWTQIYNQGYSAIESDIICNSENEYVFTGKWMGGLFRTLNKGKLWERTGYSGIVGNISSINDTTIVVGQPSGVFLSRDSGNTWLKIGDYEVSALCYNSARQILFIGTYGSVNGPEIYASADMGQNWEFISYLGYNCMYSRINSIYVSKINNYLFANTVCSDPFGDSYDFYRSIDGGQSWDLKYTDEVFDISENSLGDLYALSNYKLLISYDSGAVWITRNIQASCLAIDTQDRIYYGYGGTVKVSDKIALDWAVIGNHINSGINDMTISKNNHAYLATDNGVYFGDLNNFIVNVNDNIKPVASFMLFQNYPNPFNPATKIKYKLPELSKVKLTIYDVLGREIKTLVNEEKPAGTYEVEFEGSNLPTGVYFYRIETGNYKETKKLLLLK